MNKDAVKIICDLIYKQVITYEEAQVLIEALQEKEQTTYIPVTYPYNYPYQVYPNTVTTPEYNPMKIYYETKTSSNNDFNINKVNYTNDSKTNI